MHDCNVKNKEANYIFYIKKKQANGPKKTYFNELSILP